MAEGADYKITKLEKGPLQRFKNQNMLLKKFGEVGLQLYKAITGKRTTDELRKDMGMEDGMFNQIIDYMRDAGMIELTPAAGKGRAEPKEPGERIPGERFEMEDQGAGEAPQESEAGSESEKVPEAEGPAPSVAEEEIVPEDIGEGTKSRKREQKVRKESETPSWGGKSAYSGAEESEGITPILPEEIAPSKKTLKKGKAKEEEEPGIPSAEEETEIKPISIEEEMVPEETKEGRKAPEEEQPREEQQEEDSSQMKGEGEEEVSLEPEKTAEEGISFNEQAGSGAPQEAQKSEISLNMSPVEKIISDKYGDVGLQVYTLIDGQRTAEEIMRDTGLTESKLVEILDFMDEQGIIKLDYPKGGGAAQPPSTGAPMMQQDQAPAVSEPRETGSGFTPMIEGEESVEGVGPVPSPVEIPIKAPMDLVKSVQMKAKIMLKYGDKGGKIYDRMNGKNDVIDISLALDIPLYSVKEIVDFMMQNGMVILKPVPRMDVKKKYGDDGYAVYKLYGKEGLMLYELIGKELTIKQMADKITPEKAKIVDMFVFIHKVLGIEIPIDKDALKRQLGV